MTIGHTSFISQEELDLVLRFRKEKQHQEYGYLHLLEKILNEGTVKGDRTGTGTKSIYGTQLKFDLSKSFPILTTKKVFWKGVVEELLWFIRGETDSNLLASKGVKIWEGNTSREFLDNKGLVYPVGEIGPGYGFQWRHWGADYEGSRSSLKTDPENYTWRTHKLQFSNGIDQLQNVVNKIISNPTDRRLIVSAWNVKEIEKMALPPCHLLYQFDVSDGYLNCQWYQRSSDFFLGSPFNISSYALLTYLIAKITNLKPGTLTYTSGDTHLYLNHIEQAKEQIKGQRVQG